MDFAWVQEVERLKAKAAEFMGLFGRMEQLEPVARADPSASIRWDNLMGVAVSIRDRISYLTGLIDNVFAWFSSNGSEPPQTVQGFGALGILWVPVAVIAAAVAAIVAWSTDAYIEVEKLEAAQAFIAQGASPAEAWRLVREQDKGIIGGFLEGVTNNFVLLTALGLAAYYLPRYLKKGKR